jgi:hypothetical protein
MDALFPALMTLDELFMQRTDVFIAHGNLLCANLVSDRRSSL